MVSTTINGVLDIKSCLREGMILSNEDFPLEITVIAPPKYMIVTNTIKYKQGKEILKKSLEKIN